MKKRKERNIDPSVYEDDSSDQDFNCAVIGGALKSLEGAATEKGSRK